MQAFEKLNQGGNLKEAIEKYNQDKEIKAAFEKILAMSNEINKTVLFVGNLLSIDPLSSVLFDHKILVTKLNDSKINQSELNIIEKDIVETLRESNTNATDTNETGHINDRNDVNALHKKDSTVGGNQVIGSTPIDDLPKEVSNDENVQHEQTSLTDATKKDTSKVGVLTTKKSEYLEDIKPVVIKQEPEEDNGLFPIKQELDEENDGWTINLPTPVPAIKTEKTCTDEAENFIEMTDDIPKSANNSDNLLENNVSNLPSISLYSNPLPSFLTSNFPKPPEESPVISRSTRSKDYSARKKRSPCKDYNEKGVCLLGNVCEFYHSEGAVVIPENAQPQDLSHYGLPSLGSQYGHTRAGWPKGYYMAAETPYTRQGPQKRKKRDMVREEVLKPIQNGTLDKKKKTHDNDEEIYLKEVRNLKNVILDKKKKTCDNGEERYLKEVRNLKNVILDKKKKTCNTGEERYLKENRNLKNNQIVQEDLETEDLEELVRIKNEELLSLYDVDNEDIANSDVNLYDDIIRREEGDEIEDGEIL